MAMVKELPENGAVVVVHSPPMRDYVVRMIRDVRGEKVAKATRVLVIGHRIDVQRLYGLRVPTFVDHAFWWTENGSAEVRHLVDKLVWQINARGAVN